MNKYQEAKKWIEEIDSHPEWGHTEVNWQAIDEIKELVGKEEPTKPTFEADGYFDGELIYDTWICPNCGERYELDYQEFKRCPECGQLIDWSENE